MMYFGWTLDQWALALPRFPDALLDTPEQVLDVKRQWKIKWPTVEPGEVILAGVEYETDYVRAHQALDVVVRASAGDSRYGT